LVEHHLLITSLERRLAYADWKLYILKLLSQLVWELLVLKITLIKKTHLLLLVAAHLLILVILRHLVVHTVLAD